jgi:hypothetical protein
MARCNAIGNLEVHYKSLRGGNDFNNAIVLCQRCLSAALLSEPPGESPPVFSEVVKLEALSRAGYRCECTRDGACH